MMMGDIPGVSLYLEWKKLLRFANCHIYSRDGALLLELKREVMINSSSIAVGGQDGDTLWNLSDQNFIFLLEKSINAHQLNQSCYECKLRVCEKPTSQPNNSCVEGISDNMFRGDKVLCCRMCQNIFAFTREFLRVLPLPSLGWEDISDTLFCGCSCNHSATTSHNKLSIDPKPKDLLIGVFVLLTRLSQLSGVKLESSSNTDTYNDILRCDKCGVQIGNTTSPKTKSSRQDVNASCDPVIELYKQAFVLQETQTDDSVKINSFESFGFDLERLLSKLLVEQSENAMSYKFMLGTVKKGITARCLLVWLIEKDIQLILGDSDGKVESSDVIKVLYYDSLDANCKLYASWTSDDNVTSISLPNVTVSDLVNLLSKNATSLPPSKRLTQDSMKLSFLRINKT